MGKVPGEAPVGNIPKGLQGIHGKWSYAVVVVGKGQKQEAEEGLDLFGSFCEQPKPIVNCQVDLFL